jgi:hypothetical protein
VGGYFAATRLPRSAGKLPPLVNLANFAKDHTLFLDFLRD